MTGSFAEIRVVAASEAPDSVPGRISTIPAGGAENHTPAPASTGQLH
jgi:hypothetical protein